MNLCLPCCPGCHATIVDLTGIENRRRKEFIVARGGTVPCNWSSRRNGRLEFSLIPKAKRDGQNHSIRWRAGGSAFPYPLTRHCCATSSCGAARPCPRASASVAVQARAATGIENLMRVAERDYYKVEQILAYLNADNTAPVPKTPTSNSQGEGHFDIQDFTSALARRLTDNSLHARNYRGRGVGVPIPADTLEGEHRNRHDAVSQHRSGSTEAGRREDGPAVWPIAPCRLCIGTPAFDPDIPRRRHEALV